MCNQPYSSYNIGMKKISSDKLLPDQLFPTDYIIKKDDLIGRKDNYERLLQRTIMKNNTVLFAPRRTGKAALPKLY